MNKESYTTWYKVIAEKLTLMQLPHVEHYFARLWFLEGRSAEDVVQLLVESYSEILRTAPNLDQRNESPEHRDWAVHQYQ